MNQNECFGLNSEKLEIFYSWVSNERKKYLECSPDYLFQIRSRIRTLFYYRSRNSWKNREDAVFARFGSGALHLERREIFENLLNEYFRSFWSRSFLFSYFGIRCPKSVKPARIGQNSDWVQIQGSKTYRGRVTTKVWKQKRMLLKLSKIFIANFCWNLLLFEVQSPGSSSLILIHPYVVFVILFKLSVILPFAQSKY